MRPTYFLELESKEIGYLKKIMEEYNATGKLYCLRLYSRKFKDKLGLLEKKI